MSVYPVVQQNIAAELRRAQERRHATEHRLHQLTRMSALTDEERHEAMELSNALAVLALQIRRLELALSNRETE